MSDCRSSNESYSIVKFANDTLLIRLISDDDSSKYADEIYKFATYCKTNLLELSVKTKEMIINFRKSRLYLILLLLMIILLNVLVSINT